MHLIVGGDSTIGKALSLFWKEQGMSHHASTRRQELITESRPYIDLVNLTWPDLMEFQYDAVVFCAAATKLEDCEVRPLETRGINVVGISTLAKELSKKSSYLLLLSSNQVFDGTRPYRKVSELVCPINEYGRQKGDAEKNILQLPLATAVLRLTKVIYPELPLLKQWKTDLKAGKAIEAFTDMYLAPVMLSEVIQRIDELVQGERKGIYHLSGAKDISYYDFAKSYFNQVPGAKNLIRKSSLKKLKPENMNFPHYTSLQQENI